MCLRSVITFHAGIQDLLGSYVAASCKLTCDYSATSRQPDQRKSERLEKFEKWWEFHPPKTSHQPSYYSTGDLGNASSSSSYPVVPS